MRDTLTCPRCGYDQSGAVAAWDDECPLHGRCPECGTLFEWVDVFKPWRQDRVGFVEHSRGRGEFAVWSLRTLLWVLIPPIFWGKVSAEQRTRPGLALAWLLAILVPAHVLASTLGMVSYYLRSAQSAAPGQDRFTPLEVLSHLCFPVATLTARVPGVWAPQFHILMWPPYVLPALAFALAWPALLVVLPTTRRLARLKWQHIWRAFIFGMWWLLPLTLFRAVRNVIVVTELLDPQGGMNSPFSFINASPVRLGSLAPGFWGTVLFLWILAWWATAVVRGWNISRGWIVWLLLSISAGLVAAVTAEWEDLARVWLGL